MSDKLSKLLCIVVYLILTAAIIVIWIAAFTFGKEIKHLLLDVAMTSTFIWAFETISQVVKDIEARQYRKAKEWFEERYGKLD